MAGQFQRGEPNPVMLPIPDATAVKQGDGLALDASGNAYLASQQAWNTDKATTRAAFITNLAGYSNQVKDANAAILWNAGFPGQIEAYTTGCLNRPAAAGTYKNGDLVGPAKQSGNLLDDQIVEKVATEAEAIGTVEGTPGVNPVSVEIRFLSRKFRTAPAGGRGLRPTVAATGSTQADAAPLGEGFTVVTAADGTKGVLLPPVSAGASAVAKVKNNANAVLKVWPPVGANINALAPNAAMSIAAFTVAEFQSDGATTFYSMPLLPS